MVRCVASMASYRLRRVLRWKDGRSGTAFDSRTIEAVDLDQAILIAKRAEGVAPGFELASCVLSAPSGEILWNEGFPREDGGTDRRHVPLA